MQHLVPQLRHLRVPDKLPVRLAARKSIVNIGGSMVNILHGDLCENCGGLRFLRRGKHGAGGVGFVHCALQSCPLPVILRFLCALSAPDNRAYGDHAA